MSKGTCSACGSYYEDYPYIDTKDCLCNECRSSMASRNARAYLDRVDRDRPCPYCGVHIDGLLEDHLAICRYVDLAKAKNRRGWLIATQKEMGTK